jgi:hypothetical protein
MLFLRKVHTFADSCSPWLSKSSTLGSQVERKTSKTMDPRAPRKLIKLIIKEVKFSSLEIQRDRVQSHLWQTAFSYMGKYLHISSCVRKPFLIYDFALDLIGLSLYIWWKFCFLFYQLQLLSITQLCMSKTKEAVNSLIIWRSGSVCSSEFFTPLWEAFCSFPPIRLPHSLDKGGERANQLICSLIFDNFSFFWGEGQGRGFQTLMRFLHHKQGSRVILRCLYMETYCALQYMSCKPTCPCWQYL